MIVRRPPRVLVGAAVLVLAVAITLAVLGAFRTGVTTDEPIHVMRLRNYFDNGWYALDWDYRGSGPGGDGTNTFVYAPVAMLLLHAWSVLLGVEGWNEVSTSAHAYDVRHLGVVLIGLVGTAAVAAIGRVLLRSWQWGLVAAAALAAIPVWVGHTMVNVKDVPVATGHTLVTLGLLLFVRSEPPRTRLRMARALVLITGLVLTLGTRPGMWPGLVAVGLVALVGVVLADRSRAVVALGELTTICAVAAGVLVALYPNLFGSPLRALPRTTEASSSFLDGEKADRLYLPRHLAMEVPSFLLLLAVLGAVVGLMLLVRRWRTDPVPAFRVAAVGVQATAMPVVAVVMGSDLYHGLRQLLFALPAIAVLATYGIAWLVPRVRWAPLVATAAVLLPLVDQVSLQPYQTTYVNLATDLVTGPFAAPEERPGGDFWRASIPELIDGVPLDRHLLCKAMVDEETGESFRFVNGGTSFSTSRSLDCREEPNGPLAPDALRVDRSPPDSEYDAVFLKALPANCTKRSEVTRWRHGFRYTVSVLGRCQAPPPELTAAAITAADGALGTAAATDLWRFAVDGWLQWPQQPELVAPAPRAELAFVADRDCARRGCTLVVTGWTPTDLVARVGGRDVPVHRDGSGVRLAISAAQASAGDGVWVTFTRRSGAALGMRLTGVLTERGT